MKRRSLYLVYRKRGLRGAIEHLVYKGLAQLYCGIERVAGASVVPWLMMPLAGVDMLKRRRDFSQFVRLRNALPPTFWEGVEPRGHYWKVSRDWNEGLGTMLFYHRLGLPQWQRRFRVTGTPPHQLPEWGEKPVVVAFLHTGQFGLLRYWLRAQGVAAASLIAGLPHFADVHQRSLDIGDRLYGLVDVPHTFYASRELRDAVRFLAPGRALTVALDGAGSDHRSNHHSAGEFPIEVREGACRIGAQTNAIVLPASVRRTAPCQYEIRFGRPVPGELIEKHDFAAATQFIISELWQDLKKDPGELNWTTLEALAPGKKAKRRWWP